MVAACSRDDSSPSRDALCVAEHHGQIVSQVVSKEIVHDHELSFPATTIGDIPENPTMRSTSPSSMIGSDAPRPSGCSLCPD